MSVVRTLNWFRINSPCRDKVKFTNPNIGLSPYSELYLYLFTSVLDVICFSYHGNTRNMSICTYIRGKVTLNYHSL